MLKSSIALFALLLAFDLAPSGSCSNNSNSGDANKKVKDLSAKTETSQ